MSLASDVSEFESVPTEKRFQEATFVGRKCGLTVSFVSVNFGGGSRMCAGHHVAAVLWHPWWLHGYHSAFLAGPFVCGWLAVDLGINLAGSLPPLQTAPFAVSVRIGWSKKEKKNVTPAYPHPLESIT